MNKTIRLALFVWLMLAGSTPLLAGGSNYALWVNGRSQGGVVGNYNEFSYWGPASYGAGDNKKAVNWDGYNSIASQNGKVRAALVCFCMDLNWCYIAGDPMIGYALANFGSSTRQVKNATPIASGAGGTQTGWNLKWVRVAGGSELSDGTITPWCIATMKNGMATTWTAAGRASPSRCAGRCRAMPNKARRAQHSAAVAFRKRLGAERRALFHVRYALALDHGHVDRLRLRLR